MVDWSQVRLPGIAPGTTTVVFGAGGALGGALTSALVDLGANVARVTRSPLPRRGEPVVRDYLGDVSDRGSIQTAAAAILADYAEPPTLVVNCAGVSHRGGDLDAVDPRGVELVLATNLTSALWIAQAFAPAMRRGASFVFLSSVAAHRVTPGSFLYGASKAGLTRLVRQLSVTLGSAGIRVNVVSPGQTPTVMRDWAEEPGRPPPAVKPAKYGPESNPLRRGGELDEYVGAILFLGSDLAGYVTGADLLVDGGAGLVRATGF